MRRVKVKVLRSKLFYPTYRKIKNKHFLSIGEPTLPDPKILNDTHVQ